ncbi:MAG: hypothetical protein ACREE0_15105, partial [Phenylobacterium sp.]
TIPLGSVQVLRSRPQPSAGAAPWAGSVNVEVVRLRFTPARGAFYGPPASATATASDAAPAVLQANAFLAAGAGWFNVPGQGDFVTPPDTFDERAPGSGVSLGVVDDTCDARVEASLATGGGTVLRAHANVFVAPPDFAPDRRPFVSAADELNDRAGNAQARNAALQGEALERWVEDLFERIYEHVSLTNVDLWRKDRGRSLSNAELAAPIPGDNLAPDNLAMGSRDPLRNREATVGPFTADNPLPLADRAREQHRALADVGSLRAFVRQNPQRLRQLVRSPFEVRAGESPGLSDMRMPPFMRQSNALPLTLAAWQYDLLMRWVDGVVGAPAAGELAAVAPGPQPLSDEAAAARTAVLARVALEAGP